MTVLVFTNTASLNNISFFTLDCLFFSNTDWIPTVIRWGHSQALVYLRPACSVRVLDFAQERFRNMIPGDFESKFLTAGDSETKEGLRVEEATGGPRQCSALAP